MTLPPLDDTRIAIIGLGYVGLPLAVAFGQQHNTLGFDVNTTRVAELAAGNDRTNETEPEQLAGARHLGFSTDPADLADRDLYIVTVPTPVDAAHRPDLSPLRAASQTVGAAMRPGAVVVFESTVYPSTTEDVCVPVLEQASGLTFNKDFFVGYSPERINPGDRERRLPDIVKITSGSTPEVADWVDALYRRIIRAGTHKAPSVKVAEAAKVIENVQRDLNIALVNELALIFERMDIDTLDVLEAAGSKWNFLPFRPGLVGGHCIGVDPYYLTHKAETLGYHPDVILAGRKLNDAMGIYVAERIIKMMTRRGLPVVDADILVLGLTFKENCPDIRNTKVVDLVHELESYNARVHVHDPWADPAEAAETYGITLTESLGTGCYSAVVLAVAHDTYATMDSAAWRALAAPGGAFFFDVKHAMPRDVADARL